MAQFNDSTRRLITFLVIVIVGSVLLIFDVPVLYLLFALVFVALVFALFTGMLILSEISLDPRKWVHTSRAAPESQSEVGPDGEEKEQKGRLVLKGKDTDTNEKGKGLFGGIFSRDNKRKEESTSSASNIEESTEGILSSPGRGGVDDLDLENFDIEDIDLDPGDVRTPLAADADKSLSLDHDTKKEGGTLDANIASASPSAVDSVENESGDLLANIDDEIDISDIAAYNASDDSLYDYGSDEAEQEEQYELGTFSGGGVDDDDLLASLKSDLNDLRKRDDDVLLRDLKDFKFTAQDIADDLNEIVTMITKPQK